MYIGISIIFMNTFDIETFFYSLMMILFISHFQWQRWCVLYNIYVMEFVTLAQLIWLNVLENSTFILKHIQINAYINSAYINKIVYDTRLLSFLIQKPTIINLFRFTTANSQNLKFYTRFLLFLLCNTTVT